MSFFGKLFKHKKMQSKLLKNSKQTISYADFYDRNYPEHTLGFMLQDISQSINKNHQYNLLNPPKLNHDVLQKLRVSIHEIAPMPKIWHQIQAVLQQPDSSASDLSACITQDPILTAEILKVCNSSAYGAKNNNAITNIPLAVARLGLDEVSTVIFHSLAPEIGTSTTARKEVSAIWFHSQVMASLTRILSESCQKVPRHEAHLLGMLHDIGKLVILHGEPETTLSKLRTVIDQGIPVLDAEYTILGYTHIDAGMMLALHWKLPPNIQQIISRHHHPSAIKASYLSEDTRHAMASLHIAHLILQQTLLSADAYTSIWSSHKRHCQQDMLLFGHNELLLPLENKSFYKQLQLEVSRIMLSFPDLFPPNNDVSLGLG